MTERQNDPATIVLDGVTIRYGRTVAADSVTIGVNKGTVHALLGRNGAGKTSLIRCLLGERKPQRGSISLLGEDPWRKRAKLMARTGVVPEDPDAPPGMTAKQLEAFCSKLYDSWDARSFRERLTRFAVPYDLPFGRLSKGQKRQLMLALALGPMPEVLVLDDPTLGLDPVARRSFFEELVGELADRSTTVFLTSHDLAGVEGIADHVGVMREGRLLLDEPMDSLKGRFRLLTFGRNRAAQDSDSALQAMRPLRVSQRPWGMEAVVQDFNDEAFAAFAATPGVTDLDASPMTLEDIFVALDAEEGGRP
ncbi:MAG: ABC transporter ATP-binding protein [Acidobacteriota bacterium]|jgi:ABC-2 type transport system ATP-binding protein